MFWSLDVCWHFVAKKGQYLQKNNWMMILQLMKRKSQNPTDAKNGIDDS
jgi:hypothetical protein